MVDLNDLKRSVGKLEAKLSSSEAPNIGAPARKASGVSAEHLLKIWCIELIVQEGQSTLRRNVVDVRILITFDGSIQLMIGY